MSYLFKSFYKDIKCELREKELQDKVYKKLKLKYPDFEIEKEKSIPVRDNKTGFIDIWVRNPVNKKFIVIELKHSESRWTKKEISTQMAKYRRSYRERKGFEGVYLFSDNGKYGEAIKNLDQLIIDTLFELK